ncbi:MAG TPA: SprT-like domain-containing protein [Gemmatimonadaceae bacterium]|nr:SprT-like domain-containing protein [Gemmatimonadaceae bacterium]
MTRAEELLQLYLELDAAPRNADEMLMRLRSLGLKGITRCRLTNNRAVMVSFNGDELRLHQAYLTAPREVMQGIVTFICGRTRADRRAAQRLILGYSVSAPMRAPVRRPEEPHPEDGTLIRELERWHRQYNHRYFSGSLASIVIRISGRMRSRLGQYTSASRYGEPAEICISRAHIRRHGWAEALHTLLHEMVHQWQAEHGHAIDHGPGFRRKAREVGIAPYARRELTSARRSGRIERFEDVPDAARQE